MQAAGVAPCMAGAGVVVTKGRWQVMAMSALVPGDILAVVAVIFYALYSVLQTRPPNIHPMSFLVYTFGLGALGLMPLYFWELWAVGPFSLIPSVAASIGYVVCFPPL